MQPLLTILVVLIGLSGCVEASQFFSGKALTDEPAITYPGSLESVRIGVTTQDEVQQLLGPPTDRQLISRDGISQESWSYGKADPVIQPYQYVPLIGGLAFLGDSEPQSFSVNFSEDGIVEGISWRTVQAFSDEQYDLIRLTPGSDIPSYGTNNPMAHDLGQQSDSPSEN